MFCKGGANTKNFRPFADLQNKMHYLNDVQVLWGGGKQMLEEFLVMECKGEALEF